MADKLTIIELRAAIKRGESIDPIAFLEATMMRQDPTQLSKIYELVQDIQDMNDGPPSKGEWKELVKLIGRHCKYRISSVGESHSAARTLAEYMHPKKRSIETTNVNLNSDIAKSPLTDKEIDKLLRKWNDEF